jgi:hypothetical protein
MKIRRPAYWVLWYECIALGLIIALSWMDELCNLPNLLFGGSLHVSDWRESAMETLVVVLVWIPLFLATRRVIAHLHHLEGFLSVCAWCHKVGHDDKWIKVEDFFHEGFRIQATHGMCPECVEEMAREQAEMDAKESASHASTGNSESALLPQVSDSTQPP